MTRKNNPINNDEIYVEKVSLIQELVCEAIFDTEMKFFNIPESNIGLWHYTNIESATKIISSGRIRLSNSRYMNDRNEFISSQRSIKLAIDKYGSKSDLSVRNMLKADGDKFGIDLDAYAGETYTTSFTMNKDRLSQWRGYANSRNGVAIRFRPSKLMKSVNKDYHYSLSEVIYDEKAKSKIIRAFVKKVDKLLTTTPNVKRNINDAIGMVDTFLSRCVASFKDYSWAEEKEFRIIASASSDDELKPIYEIYQRELRPYLYLSITPKTAISEIMILDHDYRKRDALEGYLKMQGMENTVVTFSALNMRFQPG